MGLLETIILIASVFGVVALHARFRKGRRPEREVADEALRAQERPVRTGRSTEPATSDSRSDQLWLELETRLAQRPLRYPYKG